MKVVTVVGARPQFIKAAVVSRAIRATGDVHEVIIHTGQHFDEKMSAVFFDDMDIPEPHYNLEVNSLSHGAMTGRMLEKIEPVLLHEKPDMVIVYGDTNSTLAGALAAAKLKMRVAHVEAGLRSYNMQMPEEINRILTDRISSLLFCPTETAIGNLEREGFNHFDCRLYNVGDVMYDAALFYGKKSAERSAIVKTLGLTPLDYVLCTIHRQENTDNTDYLRSIVSAVNDIQRRQRVVIPLHPRTRKILQQHGISVDATVIEPVGYFDILELLKNCGSVITDSGGMQKEAFFFKKFCITVRNETEWKELVEQGYNFLAGSDPEKILGIYRQLASKKFSMLHQFYGKGEAGKQIVNLIRNQNPGL